MVVNSVLDLIGNTPLIKIPESLHQVRNLDLYSKLELFNPFGSIKDRIALKMLEPLLNEQSTTSRTVIENSSGNTAKALQAICNLHGMNFHLVSALAKVREQKDILRILGATIEEVPNASDCFDPNDPNDPQFVLERRVSEAPESFFFTSQFTNPLNPAAHMETTGEEIATDLGAIDYLIGGVGTAGSSLGVAKRLRMDNPNLKVIGITARRHDFIPGIRSIDELWENGIFSAEEFESLNEIGSREAIDGLLLLARGCGILAGPSTGANYIGGLRYLRENVPQSGHRRKAVFFACDRIDPYLSFIRERRPDLFGISRDNNQFVDMSQEEIEEAPTIEPIPGLKWISESSPLVIDTRSTVAFAQGSLPKAVNYPLDELKKLLNFGVPFNQSTPLLFVCQRGVFTRPLAAYLSMKGYDARNLNGGLLNWLKNNLPLIKPNNRDSQANIRNM